MNYLSVAEASAALRGVMPQCRFKDLPPKAIVLLMEPSPHLCPLGEVPTKPCAAPPFAPEGQEWVEVIDAFDCSIQCQADAMVSFLPAV